VHKYELDTPVAIVDLDILENNIKDMADFAKNIGVHLRPHIKTHKVPEITIKQLVAGANGITCAKLGEAELMLNTTNVDDIFIANMIVGDEKINRLLKLSEKCKISVAVDSVEVAQPISDLADKRGMKIPVIIKVDVGLRRTGVLYGKPTVDLAEKLVKMKGIELIGVYTHEGHVYSGETFEDVRHIGLESAQMMIQTAEMLRDAGIRTDIISVGATPSAKITCTINGINETRPGTYVFNDYYQIKLGVVEEKNCALTILATVISVPADDRAVVDAGTKSFTSDKAQAFGIYGWIKGMPDIQLIRAYEEHGVLKFDSSRIKLKVGDKLEIIPNHVCPAVNLFDELFVVRNEKVETMWKVSARGKLR
jgi:D-serine deaminase-like pyridoxal phosphate-dependent protein